MPDGDDRGEWIRPEDEATAPLSSYRRGRVRLLAEVADALLAGKLPSREAALFTASALSAWLQHGGAFEKHARVGAPRGSHHRHDVLYARLIADEQSAGGCVAKSVPVATDKEN